ncbi:hypothetical protein WISP_92934 [Willisornis vidua]|uniref:Uncharacterized protein n=1 Tax=Willisornis vidua TaxID=1566151 RepID=A0ABQ9D0N5_9PASS|nr:hypothetical protein WISP_92934 [Willisornis vidua]
MSKMDLDLIWAADDLELTHWHFIKAWDEGKLRQQLRYLRYLRWVPATCTSESIMGIINRHLNPGDLYLLSETPAGGPKIKAGTSPDSSCKEERFCATSNMTWSKPGLCLNTPGKPDRD